MKTIIRIIIVSSVAIISMGMASIRGEPHRVEIAVNKMGLSRMQLPPKLPYQSHLLPRHENRLALKKAREKKYGHTYAGHYHAGQIFHFNIGNKTYVLIEKRKRILIYHDERPIAKLKIPHGMLWAEIEVIKFGRESFIVIFVSQRATTHTSTLFVLNKSFKIQYQEHLLGALAFGYGQTKEYGNFFVVEAGYSPGKKESLRKLNKTWMYWVDQEAVASRENREQKH